MLIVDNATLTANSQEAHQPLVFFRFTEACTELTPTISMKNTYIMGQDVNTTSTITIGDHNLAVVDKFINFCYTIFSKLSLDVELNLRTNKAATVMARLSKSVGKCWHSTIK